MTVTGRALATLVVALLVGCSGAPAASSSPTTSPTAAPTLSPTSPATPSPAPPPTPSPSPTPGAQTLTFDDGALTIEVPAGALPDGVELSATQRGPEDRPPELADIQVSGTFYSLEPDGLTFAQPVTIIRRVAFADTGLDLATDGLPIISLALRTSDGTWSWLAEQAITTDGEFIYVAGKASHTSTLIGFGGANFAESEWTPPDLQVPVGDVFTHHATFTAPLDAPTPPEVVALDNDAVFDLFQDDFGTGAAYQDLPYDEPPTHTGVLVSQSDVFNSPGWSDIPVSQRGDAMPQIYTEFECAQIGRFFTPIGYEVVGLGAGNSFYSEVLGLGEPSTTVFFGADVTCLAAGTSGLLTPTSGCLIVVHSDLGDFISYIDGALGFPDGNAIRRVQVTIEGANDDKAVVAEPDGNVMRFLAGLRGAGQKELKEVVVTDAEGTVHDITELVATLLGGRKFNVPYPAEPTIGTCPAG